jgi:hypothetical protein
MLNYFINYRASLDIEALESLSNRGLLRRAQKKALSETLAIQLDEESNNRFLKVKVNEETVIFPKEGITQT